MTPVLLLCFKSLWSSINNLFDLWVTLTLDNQNLFSCRMGLWWKHHWNQSITFCITLKTNQQTEFVFVEYSSNVGYIALTWTGMKFDSIRHLFVLSTGPGLTLIAYPWATTMFVYCEDIFHSSEELDDKKNNMASQVFLRVLTTLVNIGLKTHSDLFCLLDSTRKRKQFVFVNTCFQHEDVSVKLQ